MLLLHSCPTIRSAFPSTVMCPLLVWLQLSPHIAHSLAFSSLVQTVDLPRPVVPTNHRSSWWWKKRCWVEAVAPVQALALQLVEHRRQEVALHSDPSNQLWANRLGPAAAWIHSH